MQIKLVGLSAPSGIIHTREALRIDILQMKRFRPLAHFSDNTLGLITCDTTNTLIFNVQ